MRRKLSICLIALNLCSCGYRSLADGDHTLAIPYVEGDLDGALTSELVRAVAASGKYTLDGAGSRYRLDVKILKDDHYEIGYEYDTQGTEQYNRLIVNEERREMTLEVKLTDLETGDVLFGPDKIVAQADYDFVDPESLPDTTLPSGASALSFSLGQLDAQEGARQGAGMPLHRKLAQKIASRL